MTAQAFQHREWYLCRKEGKPLQGVINSSRAQSRLARFEFQVFLFVWSSIFVGWAVRADNLRFPCFAAVQPSHPCLGNRRHAAHTFEQGNSLESALINAAEATPELTLNVLLRLVFSMYQLART
jgi:hypothetical protein